MPPPKPNGKKLPKRPLPPLPKLRVKNPNVVEPNPCLGVMSSVLGCWASHGYNVAGCAQVEAQLRMCMDAPVPKVAKTNNINYHLSRMYPKLVGPHKRK
ncbi:hypothetical protein IWX49DRAFT_591447 [Phyllosticta citricarpa]|uniref:Small ribosomal subunit protein mS37 n=3 Tax=Phyllosticta TaxID=121621 RepID=A0ABR1MH19_9PEZI